METLLAEHPEEVAPAATRPTQKLYTAQAIAIAAFLGGPLAGAYLMSLNYMLLGDEEAGQQTIKWGLAGFALLILLFVFMPAQIDEVVPDIVYTVAYTGLFYYLSKKLQGAYLAHHRQLRGRFMTRWRAVGVGLLGAVASIAVAVSITVFLPAEEEHKVTFGSAGHEIYFDEKTVTAEEARKVAYFLADHDFFGRYQQKQVRVEQSKWAYKVLMPATAEDFNNSSILGYYRLVQDDLNEAGFQKRVQLILFYMEGEERREKVIE